jgi:hypothetical protein
MNQSQLNGVMVQTSEGNKKLNVLRAVLSGKETRHRSGLAAAAAT